MFENLLWHLLVGTRGGETRTRIVEAIRKRPANMHKLAKRLDLDYKTVQYHIRLLSENRVVTAVDEDAYGATYFPSELLKQHLSSYSEIRDAYGKDLGKPS